MQGNLRSKFELARDNVILSRVRASSGELSLLSYGGKFFISCLRGIPPSHSKGSNATETLNSLLAPKILKKHPPIEISKICNVDPSLASCKSWRAV